MNYQEYTFLLIFLSYFLLVVLLLVGWSKILRQTRNDLSPQHHFLSVIVPVRNEEGNIGSLLLDLASQRYPSFEVIVVDDHSDDRTAEIVRRIVASDNRFKILINTLEGKKHALKQGIKVATGSIIVTTDADCDVSDQWLSLVNQDFQQDHVKMVLGGVRIQQNGSFFSNLQALEFSSLIGSAAATLALGFPTMCNGANLAFRKSVFEEVDGYEGNLHIPSGDDEFLMRKIDQKYRGGILFCNKANAVVTTQPAKDLGVFIQQRIRWASKWRHNSSFFSKALAFFILIMQLFFVFGLLQFMKNQDTQLGILLTIKTVVEGIFIFGVCRFLKVRWNWPAFIVLQFIYPLYVAGIGLFSTLLPYTWKGRTVQPVTLPD